MLELIGTFVAIYPMFMSLIWILGSVMKKKYSVCENEELSEYPRISILLPCYNEEKTIEDTVNGLLDLDYDDYEIVMINDKSTDNTLEIMKKIVSNHSDKSIRYIDMPKNGGKARGLNYALKTIESEYVMVVDSDSYVERNAVKKMMNKLLSNKKNAAVTGAPIIRNRTSVLGKLQTLEYVGIIGNIKKAQSFFFNKIMTISGVLVIYRKEALKDIDGFDPSAMTEDINATWRLYSKGWNVAYQPNAHCYILAPESIKGLIKQRRRWAVGGLEVLINFFHRIFTGSIGERFLIMEMIFGYMWAIGLIVSTLNFIITVSISTCYPVNGMILFIYMVIGIIQFEIGCFEDGEYGDFSFSDKLLIPLYIFMYWLVNLITSLQALYSVYFSKSGDGKWESSDRGL